MYDPFLRGACPVGVRTIELLDQKRDRVFPCQVWPQVLHRLELYKERSQTTELKPFRPVK